MASFDFTTDHILENERVMLRPLAESDFENLLPYSLHQPEIWKYSLVQPIGEEALRDYLKKALIARKAEKEYPFVVFDKQSGAYAGSTRFYEMDLANPSLHLGYTWYGKQYHGTGLNKHCKFLLLSFAFETIGVERVEFQADARNERSIAAMKSIGCVVEGILRSSGPIAGGLRRDSIVLSILKEEWLGGVKENLRKKLT